MGILDIPCRGGMRQDIDRRIQDPGVWAQLTNVDMTTDGRFRARRGFSLPYYDTTFADHPVTALGENASGRWVLTGNARLLAPSGELVSPSVDTKSALSTLDGQRTADSLLPAAVMARTLSTGKPRGISVGAVGTSWPDIAVAPQKQSPSGRFIVPMLCVSGSVEVGAANKDATALYFDALTGQSIGGGAYLASQIFYAATCIYNVQVAYEGPRSGTLQSTFVVAWVDDAAATTIRAARVNPETGVVTQLGTITCTQPNFALACDSAGTAYIACWRTTSTQIGVFSCTNPATSFSILGGLVAVASSDQCALAMDLSGNKLCVGYNDGTAGTASPAWFFKLLSGGTTSGPYFGAVGSSQLAVVPVWSGSGTTWVIVSTAYYSGTTPPVTTWVSTGEAGGTTAGATIEGATIATTGARLRDFTPRTGTSVFPAIGLHVGDTSNVAFAYTATGEFVVAKLDLVSRHCTAVARGLFGLSQPPQYVSTARNNGVLVPHLAAAGYGWAAVPGIVQSYPPAAGGVGQAPLVVCGTFPDGGGSEIAQVSRSWASLGGLTLFGGGALRCYDGAQLLPVGVPDVPVATAANTAGAGFAAGTVLWAVTREWTDSSGLRWQSAPMTGSVTVAGGATGTVTVTVRHGLWDDQVGASYTVWVSEVNKTVLYATRVDTGTYQWWLSNPRPDASFGAGTSFTKAITGANTSAEQLYTTSNAEPPRLTPGLCSVVGAARGRFFAASGTRVYFTHQASAGNAPQFCAGVMYLDFPEPITAIGELDGTPIVFSRYKIWALIGDGPARDGVTGQFVAQPIATDVGCIEHRSLAQTREGLWFLSANTLELLPRGGGAPLEYGLQVREVLDQAWITGACVEPENDRVEWSTSLDAQGRSGQQLISWETGVAVSAAGEPSGFGTWAYPATTIGRWGSLPACGESGYVCAMQTIVGSASENRDYIGGSGGGFVAVPMTITTGDLRVNAAAPVQWRSATVLTGQPTAGTGFVSLTPRVDTDSGTSTLATQGPAQVTQDRVRLRAAPSWQSADALGLSVTFTGTTTTAGRVDLIAISVEYEPQPGTSRVPAARSF